MAKRIPEIDAVRGLALCGLPVVNFGLTVGKKDYPVADSIEAALYNDLFLHRFVTIFCLLFGLSFGLVLHSAAEHVPRPRLVLVRRLLALLAFGVFQVFLLDGNLQLVVYASFGLVVLLPISYLPRRGMLVAGIVFLLVSLPFLGEGDGQFVKIPAITAGLLILGATAVEYGIHADPARWGKQIRAAFLIALPVAIAGNAVDPDSGTVLGSVVEEFAMLATSTVYVTGLLLLLRTGMRRPMLAALSPLGRMALTNFLVQAAAATIFAAVCDIRAWNYAVVTFGFTALFVAVQAILCTYWLRTFRYGPCEWLWRCATWLTVVPLRRNPVGSSGAVEGIAHRGNEFGAVDPRDGQ
ncbi:DUF418 domain-containing protein [Nocardia sp. NPDC020380]|uniref:DUF418 domain-containing protein n=1 Tax=Nocardia sp. NPDC020380 TaxID=3364309 RepID=UPI0037A10073